MINYSPIPSSFLFSATPSSSFFTAAAVAAAPKSSVFPAKMFVGKVSLRGFDEEFAKVGSDFRIFGGGGVIVGMFESDQSTADWILVI